ncbi:hypothetical protein COB57_01390 [Candidatus Peregrinibacteria bacterium]|nr:MAG: hypothetical protein COB57_01390 [Candidatus Peregrinibacteria bacterium]
MKKFLLSVVLSFILFSPVFAKSEPNDTKETASKIEFNNNVWESGARSLSEYSDKDYYKYEYNENTQFEIRVKNTGNYMIKTSEGLIKAQEEDIFFVTRDGSGEYIFLVMAQEYSDSYFNNYEIKVIEKKQSGSGLNEPENDTQETAPLIQFTNNVWESGPEELSHLLDRDYYKYTYTQTIQFKFIVKNTGKYMINTSEGYVKAGNERVFIINREGAGENFLSVSSQGYYLPYSNSYEIKLVDMTPSSTKENQEDAEQGSEIELSNSMDSVQKKSVVKRIMKFKDIKTENKFYNAVDYVYSNGIVDGYEDETFKTENAINRAEFTKIIMTSSSFENQIESCNNDVYAFPDTKGTWMAKYVCVAKQNGIIKGYANGQFKPGKTIQLSEALKIMFKVYSIDAGDSQDGDAWFTPYYRTAENNNLLAGVEKNAAKELTRGEAVQLIYNMRGYIEK